MESIVFLVQLWWRWFIASWIFGHRISRAVPSRWFQGRKLPRWALIVWRTAVKDMKKSHLSKATDCCFPYLPPGQQLMIVHGGWGLTVSDWLIVPHGPVWGPVNVALWEVPLCTLPSDKSSFPCERGAVLECKSKGGVGPQEVKGNPIPKQRTLVRECGCLFVFMLCSKVTENMAILWTLG